MGLDVFVKEPQVDSRLIAMPHVTLLPHVGTENRDARRKMETLALTNLRDYIVSGRGGNPVPDRETFTTYIIGRLGFPLICVEVEV